MNTAPNPTMDTPLNSAVHAVSPGARRWPRVLGLALLLALLTLAWLGPGLAGHDPRVQDLQQVRTAPSAEHWLGTDHLGRDQLARLAAALRLSLGLALASVGSAALLGTALGLWAAWRGAAVDRLTVALANGVSALPGLLLVLLVAAAWPGSFAALYAGLALAMWVEYFRVVRALAVGLLASPQVEASRLLGFGRRYLLRRHLWPALWPLLATLACFGAANAVLAMAALGFVGVGLQPPTAELGVMLVELLPTYQEAPWLLAAPAGALCTWLLGLVLVAGDRGLAP